MCFRGKFCPAGVFFHINICEYAESIGGEANGDKWSGDVLDYGDDVYITK